MYSLILKNTDDLAKVAEIMNDCIDQFSTIDIQANNDEFADTAKILSKLHHLSVIYFIFTALSISIVIGRGIFAMCCEVSEEPVRRSKPNDIELARIEEEKIATRKESGG